MWQPTEFLLTYRGPQPPWWKRLFGAKQKVAVFDLISGRRVL